MYETITKCRLCGNNQFYSILNLGEQYSNGVFLKEDQKSDIEKFPLELVKCHSEDNHNCNLVQLKNTPKKENLFGNTYGYRSGLLAGQVVPPAHPP